MNTVIACLNEWMNEWMSELIDERIIEKNEWKMIIVLNNGHNTSMKSFIMDWKSSMFHTNKLPLH